MGTRDDYVASIKAAFVSAGEKAVMVYLTAQFPWLAGPILSSIAKYFIDDILNHIVNDAETGAFFLYIDMRTDQQGQDFGTAADAYRVALAKGDPNEIAAAWTAVQNNLRALGKLTN